LPGHCHGGSDRTFLQPYRRGTLGVTCDHQYLLPLTLAVTGAGSKSFFVAPPDEVDPLVLVLRACADQMSVTLPEPVPSVMASVQLQHGDLRPLVTLQVGATPIGVGLLGVVVLHTTQCN
jgi:hypothetical protein